MIKNFRSVYSIIRNLLLSALPLALLAIDTLHAATYQWANTGGNSPPRPVYLWTDKFKWSPNSGYPNAVDDVASLTSKLNGDNHISFGSGTITLGILNIGSAATTAYFNLIDGTLVLDATNGTVQINKSSGGADIIALAVQFNDALAITNNSINDLTRTLTISGAIQGGTSDLTINGSGAVTISGVITTSGSLTKNGAGTLTLSGSNAYTGGTILNGGTLALGAANALADAGFVTINGGTLDVKTFNDTIGTLTLQSGAITGTSGVLTSTAAYDLQSGMVSAILGGSVGINKTTAGEVTLGGSNTFSGAVNANGGTLNFSTSANLGNNSATNTLSADGGAFAYTAVGALDLGANRMLKLNAGGGTVRVTSDTGVLTLSGGIDSTSTGDLVKSGPGTLILPGTSVWNSGANSVTVSGGTLRAGFGTAGIHNLTVAGGAFMSFQNGTAEALTLASSGALTLGDGARLAFELGAPGTHDQIISSVAAAVSGTITLDFIGLGGGPSAGTYNLISAASGLSSASYVLGQAPQGFNYTITRTDSLVSLNVVNYSPIYWTGSQSTTSWATINAGPLSNWATDAAGTLNAGTTPQSTDTVIFSATNASAPGGVVTTTLDGSYTLDGLIFFKAPTTPVTTSVIINQGTGGGVLTLAPSSAASGIAVRADGGAVTINAPVAATTVQTWAVDGAGASSLTMAGSVNFAAAVTKIGAGTLTLSGTNTGAGGLVLAEGRLNLNSAAALGSGALTIASGTNLDSTGSGAVTLAGGNALNWNGSFTFLGTKALDLGTGAVALHQDIILTVNSQTLTVGGTLGDGGAGYGITKAGAGALTLNGSLTLAGGLGINAGTLTLNAANTLGGGVVLNSGTLRIGHAGALGTGNLALNGGTFDNVSGAALTLSGNNAQTWSGDYTFTGSNDLNLGTGGIMLTASPTVTVSANTLTVGGAITDNMAGFGFTKSGAGTLVLNALSNYSGHTTVRNGVLQIANGGGIASPNAFVRVGNNASERALLRMDSGSSLTALDLRVGGYGTSGTGSFVMNGGSAAILGEAVDGLTYGNGGYGGVFIKDGTLSTGRISTGSSSLSSAYGVFHQTGGTVTNSEYFITWNRHANIVITNGTLDRTGARYDISLVYVGAADALSDFTVAGGTVLNAGRNVSFGQGGGSSALATSAVNLNAGSLITKQFVVYNNASTSTDAVINFNGGTLKAATNLTDFFAFTGTGGSSTMTLYSNGAFGSFNGGAVIDTNSFNVTIAQPIQAPTGNGVTSIALGSAGSGYIGAPYVEISGGGGSGATAYATVGLDAGSPTYGQVTGIVVTNPGVGYTSPPTVTLKGGGGTGATAGTVTTAANTSGGLTKQGNGTLTLTAANTYTGTTTISAGTLQIGAAGTSGTLGTGDVINNSALVFNRTDTYTYNGQISGAGTLTQSGTGTTILGGANTYTGTTNVNQGVLEIAGSITSPAATIYAGNGASTRGLLRLDAGGSLSVTNVTLGKDSTTGAGVFVLDGGAASVTGTSGLNGLAYGHSGYGGVFVRSGTLNVGRFTTGTATGGSGASSIAVFHQTGGAITNSEYFLTWNERANIVIAGGTLNRIGASADISLAYSGATSSFSDFTVAGGTVINASRYVAFGQTGIGSNAKASAALNLNAGPLLTLGVKINNGTGYSTHAVVNFNGGTLKAATNHTDFFAFTGTGGSSTMPLYSNGAFGSFNGGAVIDTNGFNVTIAQPIQAPTGNGVTSIALGSVGSGYIGAPYVEISGGGGSGATAYATVDLDAGSPTYGQVTGIVVTNPGVGYTSPPTVTLRGGGGTGATAGTVTTAANTSGGLTKQGNGTLTLTAENTYTGTTTITAGTLALGVNDVLADASAVTVNGGTLDVQTHTDTVSTVTLQNGTINGSTGALTSTDDYELQNGTVNAVLGGSVGANKTTGGTVVINSANTYTGTTTVTAGTLEANNTAGSATGSGSVILGSTAKLAGSGSIAGSTIIGSGAVLAPGTGDTNTSNKALIFTAASTAVEVQNGGQIQLGLTSSAQIDAGFDWTAGNAQTYLNSLTANGSNLNQATYAAHWKNAGTGYDSIKLINGTFNLGTTAGGTIKLLDNSSTLTIGSIFKLLDWSTVGTVDSLLAGSGTFTLGDLDLSSVAPGAGLAWDTSAFTTYGVIVLVPEPSRALLLLFGIVALCIRRRR